MLKRKSKRVLSIVLAVAMIVGLFPIAAFADDGTTTPSEDSVASVTTNSSEVKYYTTLNAAVEAVTDGGTVTLLKDTALDATGRRDTEGVLTIKKNLKLVGNGYKITTKENTVSLEGEKGPSMINIQDGANVMINDLIIDGGTNTDSAQGTKHGLNINQAGTVTLNNVTIKNNRWYAVMNNGSELVVNGLITSGNQWGINVDSRNGDASIVVNNADIAEASSIVLEKSTTNNEIPAATINGGSLQYVIAKNNADASKLTVNGGQFATEEPAPGNAVNIEDCVAPGNTLNENGQVVIDAKTAVASVNDVGYTSLQAAIDAAEKIEGTVTLRKNIDLTDGVEISGTVTLDLNGFTISDSVGWNPGKNVDYLLAVKRGGNLTINDNSANKAGAIKTTNESIVVAVKLTIKDETGEGDAATLTVNGGTLKAPFYGISGNGMRHSTKLTINGGTIEGTKGTGIYQPQDGTVTINGGTITGLTGIEIRSGQLDVNGGTFISTADEYKPVPNSSGTTVTGAAIAVSQHTTQKNINVTITGGTFRGPRAFVETNVQGIPKKGAITLTINGGTFESAVESDDITHFINGGHFALRVDPTLLAGNINTQLTDADNDVAPYSYYSRVQDAVDAADEGDTVTVLADSNENVTVSKPIKIETEDSAVYTGTVSAGNGYDVVIGEDGTITVYKEPEYTGKYSYEIFTTVGDNGAIDVDRYATEGDKVTITVSPDEAYMLDDMTITSGGKDVEVTDNGDGTYTFTMPSGDVKIEVTFAEDPNWEPEPEEPAMPFVDVDENDWFYDVVLYAYDNGLMTGVSATEFAPNQTTTRGMIVSMLARLEGVTSAEDAGFADVAENDWYATAVNWAASVGVVNGYEDDTFRPNAPITREQMAAILYNYADYKGYDVSARADLSDYADAASISSWAEDVLAWANAEGLINGMTATTIDPQGATTRAQTAAMFERFLTAHEA